MALGSESAKRIYLQQGRGVQLQVLLQHAQLITDNGAVTGQSVMAKKLAFRNKAVQVPVFR